MSVIVIEEGHPNGMDLVVKDARLNGVAKANAVPQRQVTVMPIGEGYAIVGLSLEPVMSEDGQDFCAILSLVGGRHSDLVPMIPVKLVLGELARVPLAQLREKLGNAIDGPKETPPGEIA